VTVRLCLALDLDLNAFGLEAGGGITALRSSIRIAKEALPNSSRDYDGLIAHS
jgi:hypothetical protein